MPELRLDDRAHALETAVMDALPELLRFANTVADAARQTSLRYFRSDPELLIKTDGSPVTVADRETERVIWDLLTRSYPRHGVLGEEYGWTPSDQRYTWIVDPIDGTKYFFGGRPDLRNAARPSIRQRASPGDHRHPCPGRAMVWRRWTSHDHERPTGEDPQLHGGGGGGPNGHLTGQDRRR